MHRPKEIAFNVTTKLVEARLSNADSSINLTSGQNVADYFQAIYDKVSEITEQIAKDEP